MPTIAKQTICEHDVVALIVPVEKAEHAGAWPAGTRGAVIMDLGDHKMIDVIDEAGETVDMPVIPATKLRLVAKHHSGN